MARKPTPRSPEEIARLADKAEGLIPGQPEKSLGRPTDYKPSYAQQAEKLTLLGATDADLANFFEVHRATIYRWMNSHPEFCDAIKDAKDIADRRVERSLYERAMGYSHKAVKMHVVNGEVVQTEYTEHYPPDPTSMIFWLKNRQKEKWRDRHETVTGSPNDFSRMDDNELEKFIAERIPERLTKGTTTKGTA